MSSNEQIIFGVLTVSDTCHKDPSKDSSGPRLVKLINDAFQNAHIYSKIVPDECADIRSEIKEFIKLSASAVITTGGTGFAPRDVTPEATKTLLDKECTQLTMAIALASLQKTKFAALSRGLCGISGNCLIMNFPGSEKAVIECFDVVRDIVPHALHLLGNNLKLVQRTHAELQQKPTTAANTNIQLTGRHICPHKTGAGDDNDRNSPYAMIAVEKAMETIFETLKPQKELSSFLQNFLAPVNIPPFRASIKDGYAMRSTGFSGVKKVIGNIAAGDEESLLPLQDDECFKINTGAPIPQNADCVVQVEDTKLLKRKKNGDEDLVEIMIEPKANLDIRPVGSDLSKGTKLFPTLDHSTPVIKSILASVGQSINLVKPRIAIISTGSELLAPKQSPVPGKIYDSNTTMLVELLKQFSFDIELHTVLSDDLSTVQTNIAQLFENVDIMICSGGVSMGDKDYIKPALQSLGFKIHFGRVNMKPGKPMTFASNRDKYFFGLPGNPVSAFVTFHLFVLPAIRYVDGWPKQKCKLATLPVLLQNESIPLDPRPEYVRATVTSKDERLYAEITGNQISSRLQSIIGADVLVHLPGRTEAKPCAVAGDTYMASILRTDFITNYA